MALMFFPGSLYRARRSSELCGSSFDSPENREQFRIPPHIRDIRVENGTLVVSY